ncbi:MAG: AMP-binding protein, partial [Clostridia bacterium]|nr:AMP-binding protein [Clostridia bacterium]
EWGERAAAMRPDPNDAAQLMFTSGTTGEPKGVVHTHNTLLASVWPFVDRLRLGSDDVMLMGSPIAHQTGFVYGMLVPCVIGGKAVYMDVWNAAAGLRLMEEEGVTISMGATPFLADIVNHPDLQRYDLSRFRTFVCGGAPIPRPLVEKSLALGIRVSAAWGMTENGVVTLHELDDPAERIASSDGKPQPGMELKVVDAEGRELPRGEEGRLLVRGPFNFIEYLKRPELTAQSFDAEGFFDTGDLARMDEVGYIRITGRSKDIIIRGGENIPVVEVENLLYRHPKVQDAAVVAMPDPRLGERACAYVVPKPGETFTFQEMVAYLEEQRMARQYFPERLEIVAEMPRTPSGKIQKFKLREDIRQKLAAESGQAAG